MLVRKGRLVLRASEAGLRVSISVAGGAMMWVNEGE